MSLYLADAFQELPETELRRIQKNLKIILSPGVSQERLKRTIRASYERAGSPLEVLIRLGLRENLDLLLECFGVVQAPVGSPARADLLRNPYTLWPREDICCLSGEAIDLLCSDPAFRKEDYLLSQISRLGARERKAWERWLGIMETARSERERILRLYRFLGERRSKSPALDTNRVPGTLRDVFSDELVAHPMAWFYRDVLPFYDCLREEEERALSDRDFAKLEMIEHFKYGRVFLRARPLVLGERTRYSIVVARERGLAAASVAPAVSGERQEVLF